MQFENLIAINEIYSELEIKEFIDIALVSASYDKSTALFLSAEIVVFIQSIKDTNLSYSINMLEEFAIPIFSEKPTTLANIQVKVTSLAKLQTLSKNNFLF